LHVFFKLPVKSSVPTIGGSQSIPRGQPCHNGPLRLATYYR
ncbi:MAG: hypothetical protein RLZ84_527, partial [Actinomycetota bacterium]